MMISEQTVNELWKANGLMVQKGKINLVIAPAGSGKTYWIFNTLVSGYNLSRVIYLCDTSNLKEAVGKDPEYFEKCYIAEERYEGFADRIRVMTYSMYGHMLLKNPNVFDDVDLIICDEAHNLYNYKTRFDKENEKKVYTRTVIDVFAKAESRTANVVFLTATHDKVMRANGLMKFETFYDENGYEHKEWVYDVLRYSKSMINIIDMNKYPTIRRLREKFTYGFCNYRNIGYHLRAYNGFKNGSKAIIYTDRIDTVNDLVDTCFKQGLRAVGIWSKNNQDKPMDSYQKSVSKSIIEQGLIPEDIDVLIINSAYETGINIKTENIELVIVNSTDQDTQIQARSRVRKDIDAFLIKTNDSIDDIKITLDEKWLDRPLTAKDKKELCQEIGLYNGDSRLLLWTSIKEIIINSGYIVKDHKITKIKKNDTSVSTIKEDGIFMRI